MHGGDFILEVGGGDWASHMMEHELGGMFDVAHGAGFATIWGIPQGFWDFFIFPCQN